MRKERTSTTHKDHGHTTIIACKAQPAKHRVGFAGKDKSALKVERKTAKRYHKKAAGK